MKADKRLGQHFLIDERIARRQVEFASIKPNETVLEIGPGFGVLTHLLAEKSNNIIVIEKDRRFCKLLREEMTGIDIIEGDVLKIELPDFDIVVSNLPYQISSPITFRLLNRKFARAVLMFQREFAERMTARQGDAEYSRLSVQVYYRSRAQIVENIPRSAFYPQPEVESSIVFLKPRSPPFKVNDELLFIKLVDSIFQHRRKTIENSLPLIWPGFRLNRESIRDLVSQIGFSGKRAEELKPEEMGLLADAIATMRGNRFS